MNDSALAVRKVLRQRVMRILSNGDVYGERLLSKKSSWLDLSLD